MEGSQVRSLDVLSQQAFSLPVMTLTDKNTVSYNVLHSSSSHGQLADLEEMEAADEEADLQNSRKLTFVDGLGVTVGIIIGSGIFSSPGVVLEKAGSPGMALIIWSIAGILVCATATCYFELGCMFPSAGGDFEYLTRAYGSRVSFSFAWFNFFISKPGSQAIIATIFGRYCDAIVKNRLSLDNEHVTDEDGNENIMVTIYGVTLIVVITLVNCLSIKESAFLQNALTATKLVLVVSLFVIAISFSAYHPHVLTENLSLSNSFSGTKDIFSVSSALIACLWSFDGWADLNYLMEDLQNPLRSLPKVVLTGLFTVIVAYILANIAYLTVLETDEIVYSPAIAYLLGSTVSRAFTSSYATIIPSVLAAGVALSTAGSINGSIMTGGRAFYAVARDGKAPAALASLNSFGAPWVALLAQGLWGVLLMVLPGSNFASLLFYFGPASWFYYSLTSLGVVILRRREPERFRPYKLPFYPLPVIIVQVLAAAIVLGSVMQEPAFTGLAFGFIFLSFPVHLLIERYERNNAASAAATALREAPRNDNGSSSSSSGGGGGSEDGFESDQGF